MEEKIKELQQEGYNVLTNEELAQKQNEYIKGLSPEDPLLKDVIGKAFRNRFEPFEKSIRDLTGIEKEFNQGQAEIGTDYGLRALKVLKSKIDSQKEEYDQKLKEGMKDQDLINKFDAFKKTSSKEKQELIDQIEELKKESSINSLESEINSYISGLTVREDIPEDLKEAKISQVMNELLNSNMKETEVDGKTVKALLDEHGSLAYSDSKVLTLKRKLENDLASLIAKEEKVETITPRKDGAVKNFSLAELNNAKSKTEHAILLETLYAEGKVDSNQYVEEANKAKERFS